MDVQMPGKDGYSATADIRTYEAKHGGHTPIIALTAGALEGDREMCLQAGMDDYIAKPIQIDVLREKVQHWVYEKQKKLEAEDEAAGSPGLAGHAAPAGARAIGSESGQFEEQSEVKHGPSLLEAREYLYQQGHDDMIIDQMFDMLLERGPELREAMQSALEAYDLESLRKTAHSAKGILNTLGMETAAEHAVDVEKRVDAGQLKVAASAADLLMGDLSRMVELIQREKQ
jgi:CheY-like chemotaxis protein